MIELRLVETEADVEAFLDVRRRVDPENPITRENFDGGRADADRLDLLAVLDGETVGAAWAHFPGFDRDSHYLYVSVRVVPEGRRRGAGGALFRRVSEHARVHGRSALYTVTRHDDDDSLGYLGRRGFVELGRMEDVTLVLEDTAAVIDPPQGIEIVPLGSRGELERCMYEVALEADADIPSSEPVVSGAFEDWRKRNLEPRVLRNLSFVALEDGKVVGFATLGSDGPDVAQHFMTGVARRARGRGIATALKAAQIAGARQAGIRELRAQNDLGNAPMRRVNEKLGYRWRLAWLHLGGPLLDRDA